MNNVSRFLLSKYMSAATEPSVPAVCDILMRFSSRMLLGDSMLRRAAAASLVSMVSSAPETVVSVQQKEKSSQQTMREIVH